MNSVLLLIFDLDGTLIDSKNDLAISVNLTFRDLGIAERPLEEIYGYVGNGVRRLILDSLGNAEPALLERSLEIFEAHYLKHLLDETDLYPGIEEVLLHFSGKKKAVVTNKPLLYTTKIMEGLGARNHFDLILGSEPIVNLKPHPEMILRTLNHLQVPPSEAVMIGDSPNDVLAARAAGIKSCGVGYGLGDVNLLRESKPDFFVDTVADLKRLFK
ncbi:MAG: HAD-IA family hydrolase [Nitrospirae bacterium]|nr:HAD-IA family hydrolase [Candidatus Manganitrophaceae bacterium]